MNGATFGSTWRDHSWPSRAPSALARSMNGRASTASVCARISRAVPGHEVTAIAIVIEESPWPSTAASAMASGSAGSAMNQSVTAISTLAVVPP